MKIIICGSISAVDEILKVRDELEAKGHEVEIPVGIKDEYLRGRTEVDEERAEDKIAQDLIRGYYAKIKENDSVLIVNPEKKGIKGYIGGNTLIEMAFGHVLRKKLYLLYPMPTMQYTSEIVAMQPIILNGDITKLA